MSFGVKIVMMVPNRMQVIVLGNFLAEEIVSDFEVKNVLKCLDVK